MVARLCKCAVATRVANYVRRLGDGVFAGADGAVRPLVELAAESVALATRTQAVLAALGQYQFVVPFSVSVRDYREACRPWQYKR